MKKLFKFFIPVVALVAYSCTTDTTEDLGVELGGGRTVIEVSLDGSRTHIAEAVGDKYPVYWSAGDQISVDGKASNPLTEGGSASASFEFGETLETPYCVAYPAAPKGQVLFAATQTHTDGTFGDGVATMYGYSKNGLGLTLNHLTGVLKIGVIGDATLTKAQISTIDRTPIAGPFAIEFVTEEGEEIPTVKVTPTAESVDVIEYSFGYIEESQEGGVSLLPEEPTYLHVAVPAGVYNELYVTLYDTDGGVMYATVKATDEKPLTAGNVRTFSNAIEYAANADVFVVSSVATLRSFASQAKESSKDVVFVEDINMTGAEWTPIKGYSGNVNGNGYAIKGLTAPLFDTTQVASIRGLHLEDVNINETATYAVGALARVINNNAAVIENCSASGSITVDGTESTVTPGYRYYIAGLIGQVTITGDIKNIYCNVKIEAKGTYNQTVGMAGCIGLAQNAKLYNATNHGTLTFSGEAANLVADGITGTSFRLFNCTNGSADDDTHTKGSINVTGVCDTAIRLGGICDAVPALIENSHNYGKLTFDNATDTSGPITATGIVCNISNSGAIDECVLSYCTNNAPINVNIKSSGLAMLGGITSRNNDVLKVSNCTNNGSITIDGSLGTDLYLGGIIGVLDQAKAVTCESCTNNGALTANCDCETGFVMMGGISSRNRYELTIKESTNYGDLIFNGNINNTTDKKALYMGGIIAVQDSSNGNYSNNTATNKGDIIINGEFPMGYIGGVVGRFSAGKLSLHSVTNTGDITMAGTANTSDLSMAGILGHQTKQLTTASGNALCTGNLTFTGTVSGGRLIVGGIIGATNQSLNASSFSPIFTGNITCTGRINTAQNNRIGGIVGETNNKAVKNSQCFTTITAYCIEELDEDERVSQWSSYGDIVGFISGVGDSSATISTTNTAGCKVGGTICIEPKYSEEPPYYYSHYLTLSSINAHEYIFGTTVDESFITGETITILSSKEEIVSR